MNPTFSWFDRAITRVAPQYGLRRLQARMASDVLLAYEGAKSGRRTDGWITAGTDGNSEINAGLPKLRDRSHDLARNNPDARRAKKLVQDELVGTGIIPEPDTGDDRLDEEIKSAFEQWSDRKECDAAGRHDFFGLEYGAAGAIFESGEILCRHRVRRSGDGLTVPIRFQMLESDFLDMSAMSNKGGGATINGVDFNALGEINGFWLFPNHPGSTVQSLTYGQGLASKFVPADFVSHAFVEDRTGDCRGVPWLAPVIMKLRDVDELDEAELVRSKIAACLALFVSNVNGNSTSLGPAETDASGNRVERMRPGMIMYGRAGEDARPIVPPGHQGFAEYLKLQQQRIAAGVGLNYWQLSGDLSAVNYSSSKAGDRGYINMIESVRHLFLIPMLLQPMWNRFIDTAYLVGRISKPSYRVKWIPPKFRSASPLQDAETDQLRMICGTLDLYEAIGQYGNDPKQTLERIAQIQKFLRDKEVVLPGLLGKLLSLASPEQVQQPTREK